MVQQHKTIMENLKFTPELQKEMQLINIPVIENNAMFQSNQEKAESKELESCPCCGKAITNQKFYIHSAFGGACYIPTDEKYNAGEGLSDTWTMWVGSECKKKFPEGYVFKSE